MALNQVKDLFNKLPRAYWTLDFFQPRSSEDSFVLLMHIPIYLPGLTWGPTDVMGHPSWGDLA